MAAPVEYLTTEYLRECLSYDPETGILTWRVRPLEHFKSEHCCNAWNAKHSEKKAGWPSRGYLRVGINGKMYRAHRVIWKMETGHWPPADLDHINGDRADNRLSNLRAVSNAENSRNASISKNNTSGTTGVNWYRPCKKWRAEIKVNGRKKHIGYFTDKAEAIAARKAAEIEYGFHPNHGKSPCKR